MSTLKDTAALATMFKRIHEILNDISTNRLSDVELYRIGYNLSVYISDLYDRKLYPVITDTRSNAQTFKVHIGYKRTAHILNWVYILNSILDGTKVLNLQLSGWPDTPVTNPDIVPPDVLAYFESLQQTEGEYL